MGTRGEVYLARQPILDARTRIVGHEILYRDAAEATAARIDSISQASAQVMLRTFANLDVAGVLGSKLGFFNVNEEILASDMVESLPRDRVVLEILETLEPTAEVARRCRELRRRGFSLALDDYVHGDPRESLIDRVQYVKIDLPAVPPRELKRLVARLKARNVKLLAEKVETQEEFEHCRDLGFQLFQGYYFARPLTLSARAVDPARAAVMDLLRKLSAGAGLDEIAADFKRNTSLGLMLLRIVNSVELARRQRIQHVEQALVLLGERRLKRWLSLLLFAGDDTTSFTSPLLQTAAMRGRLLELIAREMGGALAGSDGESRAFLTGMLSLADVLLGTSRVELVQSMCLEQDIADALLQGEGRLGRLLELAERVERAEFEAVAEISEELGLAAAALARAQLAAFRWVGGLEGAGEESA